MEQAEELETAVNMLPTLAQIADSECVEAVDAAGILKDATAAPPLARRVKVSFSPCVFFFFGVWGGGKLYHTYHVL